ncbi:hypothetical protein FNV43_RR26581 [Rhamnella rubrinervis]|uniref:F-box domain-containing protein n=1 Tax=Rhamnella rubrinervis TaxID=2594499 RepID=A0A8K0GRN4_9ROSA|nr:hypothetical protein FNV43_RR26581 [Rhamnella rubrinervis]
MEKLPEDLEIQILLRLPVKALLRFQSICKLWYSGIRSPKFISDHCEVSNTKNPYDDLIAKFYTKTDRYDLVNVSTLSHETLEVVDTHLALSDGARFGDMEIVSSCNGVVCLYDRLDHVVVLICYMGTYNDGKYSWFACIMEESTQGCYSRDVVISFDMSNDVAISTPLPNDIVKAWETRLGQNKLRVLGGFLAVINGARNGDGTQCYNIWVLGKYGVMESWNKLFTIPSFQDNERPLGFWRNCKLFVVTDAELVLVDIVTQERCRSPSSKPWEMIQVFSFKESSFVLEDL